MTKPPNYGHLDEIPISDHTREWFKKDIVTVRKSTGVTIRRAPTIIFLASILTVIAQRFIYPECDIKICIISAASFSLIAVFAFFLLHVLKTKGYDIRTP